MNIVIVEDHRLFRELIHLVCTREFGHAVVGETDSGSAAIELILRLKPDITLLDLELADDIDGFSVAERVQARLPAMRVIALSSHLDAWTITRIHQCQLHGFVDKKSNTASVLRDALTAVSEGRQYFSPAYWAHKHAGQADPIWVLKILSDAEQQILSLIGLGLNDREIGDRLGISHKTSQTHRSRILVKLGIRGTPKLIAFAIHHGFTRPGQLHRSLASSTG